MFARSRVAFLLAVPVGALLLAAKPRVEPADIILLHGRVHSLHWGEPNQDGAPARDAPHDASGWHPDAQAIAIRGAMIVYVGDNRGITAYRGPSTRVIDIAGKTAVPGLIDAHVHVAELGATLSRGDRAVASPARTQEQLEHDIHIGLDAMAKGGYVSAHEAGADATELAAFQALDKRHELPIRVYVMLAASDTTLCRLWLARGPDTTSSDMLIVRAVNAVADGALGSRGARLVADYSDQPGQRGTVGASYGYDSALVAAMMRRGFQVAIDATGDAANHESIDFISSVVAGSLLAAKGRPRIEHAQVLSPADIPRLARTGIIASVQPTHAVEDMAWAEDRLGPDRIHSAYAWRALRKSGTRLVFGSGLPAGDYDIFYGLHSAITRQGRDGAPPGGWYRDQAMSPEEALRGFTSWAAYAEFGERRGGTLAPGMHADITVMDIDPLVVGAGDPLELLKGKVSFVIAGGRVITASRR